MAITQADGASRSSGLGRADYGVQEQAMQTYLQAGEQRAYALNNRGPIKFARDGQLHPRILSEYSRCGFYIFEQVIGADELRDLRADLTELFSRLPVEQGASVDAQGRPALAIDCTAPSLFWAKPLADPFGGTKLANGRHPVKMSEPTPPAGAPKELVYVIQGPLQFSSACLRLYGHPQLLAVAAAVNGHDFTPFTEALFVKAPGLGASVAWHRDGITHWHSPDWDESCHGFNFMAQVYGSTAANGVWVVPGTHRMRSVDIPAMVAQAGSDRLADAVPVICQPGDVVICNRQTLHGSFANTSADLRVTVNLGFHRRSSVLGVTGGGVQNARAVYDAARIETRARMISYGIDARQQCFESEEAFDYQPARGQTMPALPQGTVPAAFRDYNLLDLSI